MTVRAIELRAGQSWLGPTAEAVAHLQDWIRSQPDGGGRGIRFALPDGHPALRCLVTRLTGGSPGSYGLYVRAADPLGLVRAVAPVLEARLAASPAVGWTGDLRVDLYTSGLHLRFDGGRLTSVEPWAPPPDEGGPRADASMAIEDFLHLFLGNRRLDDLERASADCIVDTDAGALLRRRAVPAHAGVDVGVLLRSAPSPRRQTTSRTLARWPTRRSTARARSGWTASTTTR